MDGGAEGTLIWDVAGGPAGGRGDPEEALREMLTRWRVPEGPLSWGCSVWRVRGWGCGGSLDLGSVL